MRRIIIEGLLSCLLALFPGLMLAQTLTGYEYWFDDDFAERQAGSLSGAIDMVNVNVDARRLPQGVHTLSIRARQSDGMYSAVTTSTFIKISAGVGNKLEYWIDDDRSHVTVIEGSLASDGKDYIFNKDLDMRAVSPGLHRLNLRPRSTSGRTSGAITTADFIKISTGTANKLEYWLDGDHSTVHVIEGSLASDGKDYIFVNELDLGDVTPGYHRLYYRAISSTDLTASAVSMSPIIVKSRYYHSDDDVVSVDRYGITVDDGQTEMFAVPNPQELVTQNHTFDASKLSPGNHTVKATFWNSMGVSVTAEQAFKVIVPEEPRITLTAVQDGGLVKLHFNTIANDKGYRLYRTLNNGTPKIVDHNSGSIYPSNVNYSDNPAAGTYKYQALIPYTDRDGTNKVLKSNEVTVTVNKAQTEEESAEQYGSVVGRIVCDKNAPTSGLMVKFSNDDETVPVQGALFRRDKILKDTEVTLTVEGDETHEYEPVTLTVHAGANDVTLNGKWQEENQPNNLENDLIMASNLDMVNDMDATYLKFWVKNRSLTHSWYGKVRVRAIDKKKADKAGIDIQDMEYGTRNMYTAETEDVFLAEGATREISVALNDLQVDKNTEFYLYFESVGHLSGTGVPDEAKLIWGNSHYNVNMNPIVWTIPKTTDEMTVWDQEAKEKFALFVLGMSCVTPGMSGLVGDLQPFVKEVISYTGQSDTREAALYMADLFKNGTALEALNDPQVTTITRAIRSAMMKIHDKVEAPLIEKFWKTVGGKVANAIKARDVISELRNINTVVTSDDLFEQCVACSKLFYQALLQGQSAPLSSMMYTYMVVGRSLIEKASQFGVILHDTYLPSRVLANSLRSNITDANNCNTTVNYKLIVKSNGKPIDFTNLYYQKQIDRILVKASNMPKGVATFHFDLDFRNDGVVLKCKSPNKTENTEYVQPIVEGGTSEEYGLTKFEMEIYWSNGRVTYIPLIEKCDGLEIKRGDGYYPDMDAVDTEHPSYYTVTLTTATGSNHISEELYMGNNKERK